MNPEITDEQRKVAKEIFGDDTNVNYMLMGKGLRRELTLQMLDALIEARAERRRVQESLKECRERIPIRQLGDKDP